MEIPPHFTPFLINIDAETLSDLRERIRNTRWPDSAPGAAWEKGQILMTCDACLRIGPTNSTGARKSVH